MCLRRRVHQRAAWLRIIDRKPVHGWHGTLDAGALNVSGKREDAMGYKRFRAIRDLYEDPRVTRERTAGR